MHDLPVDLTFLDKHGLALTLVVVFAVVIAYLFRLLVKSHDDTRVQLRRAIEDRENAEKMRLAERDQFSITQARWDVERAEHDLEISKERQFCEQRIRENLQQHQKDLHELRKEFQAREDAMRREHEADTERMSSALERAMEKIQTVLQKFYDRYVGPRTRRGG